MSNELFIIASLGDGTADADGWLKMTVHTLLRKQSTSQKGQSLPFPLVASRSNGCFYMVQQTWFLVSWTYLSILCTITYLTRCKERGTIRIIPELVHNLASAFALCAPMIKGVPMVRLITLVIFFYFVCVINA